MAKELLFDVGDGERLCSSYFEEVHEESLEVGRVRFSQLLHNIFGGAVRLLHVVVVEDQRSDHFQTDVLERVDSFFGVLQQRFEEQDAELRNWELQNSVFESLQEFDLDSPHAPLPVEVRVEDNDLFD